jgi:hypothetical protein
MPVLLTPVPGKTKARATELELAAQASACELT